MKSCFLIAVALALASLVGCGPITPPTPGPGPTTQPTFADQIASAADIAYADLTNPLLFPPGVIPANDLAAALAAKNDIDSLARQYDAGTLTVATFTLQASADAFIIYTIANKPAVAGKVNPPALLRLKSAAAPAAKAILK